MLTIADPEDGDSVGGKSNEKNLVGHNCNDGDYLFTPMTQSMSQTFDYSDEDFHLEHSTPIIIDRSIPGSEKCALLSRGAGDASSQCKTRDVENNFNFDDHCSNITRDRIFNNGKNHEIKNDTLPLRQMDCKTKRNVTISLEEKISPEVWNHRPTKRQMISKVQTNRCDAAGAMFTSAWGQED
jgi:hypothetical protein